MPFLHKAMENNPIKIHLSIMQFLRLNERMDVCSYMCNVNTLASLLGSCTFSLCVCLCCIHIYAKSANEATERSEQMNDVHLLYDMVVCAMIYRH